MTWAEVLSLVGIAVLMWGIVWLKWWLRQRVWRCPDDLIDDLIVPPRERFGGYDPAARETAAARREKADYVRRMAARWESTPGLQLPEKDEIETVGPEDVA